MSESLYLIKNSFLVADRIRRELSQNRYTVPCLLFRDRVLVTDHGILSHQHDKELVALLDGGINGRIGGYFWYGHVLRVALRHEAKSRHEPEWAALIVPSTEFVDAPTVDLVFRPESQASNWSDFRNVIMFRDCIQTDTAVKD